MLFQTLVVVVLVVISVVQAAIVKGPAPGSDIQVPKGSKLLKTGPKGSSLYQLDTTGSVYAYAPYVLNLTAGTSFDQGYDAGYLMGGEFISNYNSLMIALLGDEWWEPAVAEIISRFLDWQWNSYLSVELPEEYKEELRGLSAGGKAAGFDQDIGALAGWGVTLANLPGSLENIVYVLADEKAHPYRQRFEADMLAHGMSLEVVKAMLKKIKANWNGLTCSMFGVWGSRTANGALYTGRNLDWLKDSGIST